MVVPTNRLGTLGEAMESLRINELDHAREFAAFPIQLTRYALAFIGMYTPTVPLRPAKRWSRFASTNSSMRESSRVDPHHRSQVQ